MGEKENLGSLDNWQSVKTDIRTENGLTIKNQSQDTLLKLQESEVTGKKHVVTSCKFFIVYFLKLYGVSVKLP